MRTTSKLLALAFAFSAATVWAQETATPPAPPTSDEGAVTQPAPAPVTQNPIREDDATPQSATQGTQDTAAPPAEMSTEPQGAQAAPPEPKSQTAEGKILSQDATTLVIETSSGNRLRLTIDADTAIPSDLKAEDAVSVEYLALNDGSLRATRVSLAQPKPAEVAPVAPQQAQTPPPSEPARPAHAAKKAMAAPVKEQASAVPEVPAAPVTQTPAEVAPAANAATAAPVVADPVTSGASSETSAPEANAATSATSAEPVATATTTASSRAPWSSRMIFPLLLLASGIAFIAVLGVRQARHAA